MWVWVKSVETNSHTMSVSVNLFNKNDHYRKQISNLHEELKIIREENKSLKQQIRANQHFTKLDFIDMKIVTTRSNKYEG